jgi:plastocyanin/outer membrane murein-binding lipoprotein Lpp
VTNIKRSTTGVSLGMYISGAATLLSLLAAGPTARAQEAAEGSSEVDELRKQVRGLEAQVQALRSAINDSIDLNRQQIASLNRALKGQTSGGGEAPSMAAPARSDTGSDNARPPPSLPKSPPVKGAAAAVAARGGKGGRRGEDPVGVIRGKVDVPSGEPVAYVYVENIFEPAVRGRKETITQKEKHFVPRWAVVQRGTTIEFPNSDNIYHNVFSLSSGNSFDLGLYNSSSEAKTHVFNEPGAVDIYCNIHPQMAASALVVPNRHFAKVKPDGTYEIGGIPGGKRKVVAWAPGSQLTSQWVEVESGGTAELNLKLESKSAGHKNKAGRVYGSYE